MSKIKKYIPTKGDLVWIDFDSSSEQESQKHHPGLVVSRYVFNRKTHFVVICPITSTLKDLPTRYSLPNEATINGQVIRSQLTSFDFNSRIMVLADHLPIQDMAKIDQIIAISFKHSYVCTGIVVNFLFIKFSTRIYTLKICELEYPSYFNNTI